MEQAINKDTIEKAKQAVKNIKEAIKDNIEDLDNISKLIVFSELKAVHDLGYNNMLKKYPQYKKILDYAIDGYKMLYDTSCTEAEFEKWIDRISSEVDSSVPK